MAHAPWIEAARGTTALAIPSRFHAVTVGESRAPHGRQPCGSRVVHVGCACATPAAPVAAARGNGLVVDRSEPIPLCACPNKRQN
eukprot:2370170-Prymnesium_polylepis.1